MKSLLLSVLLLMSACDFSGSSNHKDEVSRLKKEAEDFCSCRGGVDILTIGKYSLNLTCKNNTTIKNAGTDLEYLYISGCK